MRKMELRKRPRGEGEWESGKGNRGVWLRPYPHGSRRGSRNWVPQALILHVGHSIVYRPTGPMGLEATPASYLDLGRAQMEEEQRVCFCFFSGIQILNQYFLFHAFSENGARREKHTSNSQGPLDLPSCCQASNSSLQRQLVHRAGCWAGCMVP